MPPRIPLVQGLRAFTCKQTAPFDSSALPFRPFSSSTNLWAKHSGKPKKSVSRDPYTVEQRNLKKRANLSRRAKLEQDRISTLGDPVRGISTPFVQSFETGKPVEYTDAKPRPKESLRLNYAYSPEDVARQIQRSEKLAVPLSELDVPKSSTTSYPWRKSSQLQHEDARQAPKLASEIAEQDRMDHIRAAEAVSRIVALDNGSSKDRLRVNIARSVETFGRHNTDKIFPPRAPAIQIVQGNEMHPVRPETNVAAAKNRIGPDTGSSEVQISILTAKIKTLADFLATRGKGDKHNKRNLRLLVHRRQKLLKYLRRKERGGPRWQHCIETLGLTEGTWKGEISL